MRIRRVAKNPSMMQYAVLILLVLSHPAQASHPKDGSLNDANDDTTTDACGLWLAPSTIPGAGLGLFAGRDFEPGEPFASSGELVIPIVDAVHYFPPGLLMTDYCWNGKNLGMDSESSASSVVGLSPGFGAAVNTLLGDGTTATSRNRRYQVEMTPVRVNDAGLNRREHPGAGAISHYHDRRAIARERVEAGDELFVEYGDDWLRRRQDHERVVVMENQRANPEHGGDLDRSEEWLEQHGMCADNMHVRQSTLPQAGRGAFASRNLRKGTVVALMPLLHFPDRAVMEMYNQNDNNVVVEGMELKDGSKQLLLNYCFGHRESTLLLFPYGVHDGFVNHNRTLANVRLQWADPAKSNHHPGWLDRTVDELEGQMNEAGLAMELVATRDIRMDEEIFMDYGQEWEEAWTQHVAMWTPWSEIYRGANELNRDEVVLRTVFEAVEAPYPANTELKCLNAFLHTKSWKMFYPDRLNEFLWDADEGLSRCKIVKREMHSTGRSFYTAELEDEEDEDFAALERIPREAFQFVDRPYTSDMHLPSAFRHEIMIPDDLFPEQWKNAL